MSGSIQALLRGIERVGFKPPEGKIHNPDIPGDTSDGKFDPRAVMDERPDDEAVVKDQYDEEFRMTDVPRNGMGHLGVRGRPNYQLESEWYLRENAIDPNLIRARTDPDHAIADLRSDTQSLMPGSTKKSSNQVGLIQQSKLSELNWRNRYMPPSAVPPSTMLPSTTPFSAMRPQPALT